MRLLLIALLGIVLFSSCSKQRLVANGARHEHPIHLGDEYSWEELDPVEGEGRAVFGIPFAAEGQARTNASGLIIHFDGPGGFRFPKVIPMLTMIAGSFATAAVFSAAIGQREVFDGNGGVMYRSRLPIVTALPLAIPVWGGVQNAVFSGISSSGVTGELQLQLIQKNPDVDLFFNPRYDIQYNQGLFTQSSVINARVKGATMLPSDH